MRVRTQDMLIAIARENGMAIDTSWPLLAKYLRWFLSGGGRTWTSDPACTLFWLTGDGRSLGNYWGINIASLTDRIMSAVWHGFMDIHGINSRTAFLLERIDHVSKSVECQEMLSETYTTPAHASQFALEHSLKFPAELRSGKGRQAGVNYKEWCHETFERLIRNGFHRPYQDGLIHVATQIHLLLGGKVEVATAEKVLRAIYKQHVQGLPKKLVTY